MGTSGWQYADWRGVFYPGAAKLEYYADRFRTVELNASFYRLPARTTFEGWAARTPDDFVMGVKASRYLTHLKRLREPAEPVARLLGAAGGLGAKLGPVLVQLPGSFAADPGLLAEALSAFPPTVRVACEFRHGSWFAPAVRQVLTERGAALCWADRDARWLTPRWRTAPWGYVRFHWGAGAPAPCYPDAVLAARAADVAAAYPEDEDVYVYFNNDPLACALHNARTFAVSCRSVGLSPTRVD